MRRRNAVGLVFVLAMGAIGCQADNFERYRSTEDGFSVRKLDGWTTTREKGTVLLRQGSKDSHATIAIRSVALESSERETQTRKTFLDSTAKVLRSYPEAEVHGPTAIDGDPDRMEFELTFVPESKGKRYQRKHVVVFERGHVFQLWHTAPAGHLEETSAAFAKVVDSIREEV